MAPPPRLSVITITYNDPDSLERTLRSLKALVGAPFEWELVVVDSSPEKNEAVIAAAPSLPLVRLREPANGVYPAMNAGLARAGGEFLWFLNGGDELADSAALIRALAALAAESGKASLLAAAELYREGRPQYVRYPDVSVRAMIGINRVCHQAILYRRSFFRRFGPFSQDYRFASDYELHLRAFGEGERALPFPEVIVRYDMGGLSSDPGKVFAEFARVQTHLKLRGLLPLAWAHGPVRVAERGKMALFGWLKRTPLGPALGAAWRGFQRSTGEKR